MINSRIEELINYFSQGNKSLFSKQIGVTPSVIGNITGERKGNPSFDVVNKIINAFVNIDANWLITGQGSMLREFSFIEPDNWIEWSKKSHQSNYRLDTPGLRLSEIATQKKLELFELKNLIGEDDNFYKMVSGEIRVSEIVLDKIHDIYPDISVKWMYTGHGDMFSPITESAQQLTSHQQENNIISLLKEQLKEERQHSEKQAQEIGMLKSDNRKLMEQVMGLDISERKSSTSPSPSQSKDAPSAAAHL